MQNGLGITLKSSVIFKVKGVKGFNNYYRKNLWKHAEKFRSVGDILKPSEDK